jgi:flagellar hook-associated protein 2
MASITTLGVGSGLPLDSLLAQLETAEKAKLQPITTQKTANTAKISAFGTIKSVLTSLQSSISALKLSKTFTPIAATSSGTGVVVASTASAVPGSYQVKVNNLASAHNIATQGVASKTTGLVGAGTLSVGLAGNTANITIAEGSSLETIRNQINNAGTGVTASIVNTGDAVNPYKLSIASKTTGTDSQVSMSFTGTGSLTTLLSDGAHAGSMTQVQAATNASLEVNGMAISSQTNTVADAIQGVTMTLKTAGSTQTVDVAKDNTAVTTSIKTFVDAYNKYVAATQSATAFNEDPTLSGKLLGDSTLRGIKSSISAAVTTQQTVQQVGDFSIMSQFGVKLTPEGTLQIDNDKLTDALTNNPDAVSKFFTGATGVTGFASRLDTKLSNILSTGGALDSVTSGLTKTNTSLDDQSAKMSDSIAATVARYRTQFAAMDSLVSKGNATMSYLTQQFTAMANQMKSN